MKAQAALRAAAKTLTEAGIDGAARDARALLSHAMAIAPDRLSLQLHDDLDTDTMARLQVAIAARAAHQPVAQIIGTRLFWGLSFRVTPDTLDPRPETETLVKLALEEPFHKILDLGTGTGCILLSCLSGMPVAHGTGTDISAPALAVARGNAVALGMGQRATFIQSDWCADVPGRHDLIVSNPPYIAAHEMPGLAPDVRDWEPHLALTPGGDGLDAYRAITRAAPSRLIVGGRLIVEIGPTQAAAVAGMMTEHNFADIRVLQDLDGRDRVICGRKQENIAV